MRTLRDKLDFHREYKPHIFIHEKNWCAAYTIDDKTNTEDMNKAKAFLNRVNKDRWAYEYLDW